MILTQLQGIQLGLLSLISLFGVVQGILITGIILWNKKYDIPTKRYFALLFMVCVSINVFELIHQTGLLKSDIRIWILPVSFFPLIIPTTYFIFKYYVTTELKVKPWEYLLYLPFVLGITRESYTTIQYLGGNLDAKVIDYTGVHHFLVVLLELTTSVICIFILIYFLIKIRDNKKEILKNFPAFKRSSLRNLRFALIAGLALACISITICVTDLTGLFSSSDHNRGTLEMGFTILIYWLSLSLIISPEIFTASKPNSTLTDENTIENANEQKGQKFNKLSDNTDLYHQKLLSLMTEKGYYRDPDFNLDRLSKEMNLSKSYISKIINKKEGKNFFDFVNSYRIEEVKKKLEDEAFDHFSIIALAYEAGFKSKSTFNSVFKKMTGMPPSKYKKSQLKS